MTEADTCREFVTPKLVEAGWGTAELAIDEGCAPVRLGGPLKNPNAKAALEHAE